MSDNETGLSPAAASRSRAVEGLALSIDLYDRVHAEIDAGKHWSNIDCGSKSYIGEKYSAWLSYMQQRIINEARGAVLSHRSELDQPRGLSAVEAPISAEDVSTNPSPPSDSPISDKGETEG